MKVTDKMDDKDKKIAELENQRDSEILHSASLKADIKDLTVERLKLEAWNQRGSVLEKIGKKIDNLVVMHTHTIGDDSRVFCAKCEKNKLLLGLKKELSGGSENSLEKSLQKTEGVEGDIVPSDEKLLAGGSKKTKEVG